MGAEGEHDPEGAQDKVSKTSAEMEAWANKQGQVAEAAARASATAANMHDMGGPSPENVSEAVAHGGLVTSNAGSSTIKRQIVVLR
jgi:hypothetical protein